MYVPGLVTVIEELAAPLLHNKVPEIDSTVNTELPQLFTTITKGADIELTVNVAGFELTGPALFVHTARYCLLLSAIVVVNDSVALTAPAILFQVVPFILSCHCTVGTGAPLAAEIKDTLAPAHFV